MPPVVRVSASGMEGGFIRGDHYMAGCHIAVARLVSCADGSQLVAASTSHRNSKTGGATRGP